MIGLKKHKAPKKLAPRASQPGAGDDEIKTRLDLLYEVALQACSIDEVATLIDQILALIQGKLSGTASSLLLVDEKKSELYFQSAGGKAAGTLKKLSSSLNSGIAGWVVQHRKPVVVNDVSKEKRFSRTIDQKTGFTTRSIIAAPVLKGKRTLGVIEVLNKADDSDFDARDLAIITGFAATEALILLVSMAHMAINNINVQDRQWFKGCLKTAEALAQATDAKDTFGIGHSERVRDYTMKAASDLSLSLEELQAIEFGALLHDIGKMGIDEKILRKPGPLTDDEWATMKEHSMIGANMVGEIPILEKARPIILHHHEKYDGSGYPKGLKGEDIPLGARLVAVCDAFDTMTTEQSYSSILTAEEAIEELISGSGAHFCPVAVRAFINAIDKDHKHLREPLDNQRAAEAEPAETETEEIIVQKLGAPPDEAAPVETEAGSDTETQLFEGEMTLAITNVSSSAQVKQIYGILRATEHIKISMAGWSEEKGHIISVSLDKAMPLRLILGTIPNVEKVYVSGKDTITVDMATNSGL